MIDKYDLIIFLLVFGFTDRLREIAGWPWWISKWGGWFDTHDSPGLKWFPFRDAYHTFKFVSNASIIGMVWYFFGYEAGFYAACAWGLGQFLGLMAKK